MSTGESGQEPQAPSTTSPQAGGGSIGSMIVKLLLLMLVLFAGVVGGLYALGGNQVEVVVTEEIETGDQDVFKLRSKVYRLITDPEYVTQWVDGLKKIEPTGDIEGHRVGALSKVTVESEGKELQFDEEVTTVRKNEESEIKLTSDLMDMTQNFLIDYETKKHDNETKNVSGVIKVTHTLRANFKGYARLTAIFAKAPMQEKMKADLAKLKSMAEDKEMVVKPLPRKRPPRGRGGSGRGGGGGRSSGKGKKKSLISLPRKNLRKNPSNICYVAEPL